MFVYRFRRRTRKSNLWEKMMSLHLGRFQLFHFWYLCVPLHLFCLEVRSETRFLDGSTLSLLTRARHSAQRYPWRARRSKMLRFSAQVQIYSFESGLRTNLSERTKPFSGVRTFHLESDIFRPCSLRQDFSARRRGSYSSHGMYGLVCDSYSRFPQTTYCGILSGPPFFPRFFCGAVC